MQAPRASKPRKPQGSVSATYPTESVRERFIVGHAKAIFARLPREGDTHPNRPAGRLVRNFMPTDEMQGRRSGKRPLSAAWTIRREIDGVTTN